jgi:hypothetical protein
LVVLKYLGCLGIENGVKKGDNGMWLALISFRPFWMGLSTAPENFANTGELRVPVRAIYRLRNVLY